LLAENNPNRRMILLKNPLFHLEKYPVDGELEDKQNGMLADAEKKLPFIDKVVFMLEKETIPYWTKFLQGYYDASGIASDSFDQAIQFTGSGGIALTDSMKHMDIQLQTLIETSIFYMGLICWMLPLAVILKEPESYVRQFQSLLIMRNTYPFSEMVVVLLLKV
jgi:hypothetical protein